MNTTQLQKFETELKRKVKGELRFDDVTRFLYSTDASLYEIQPVGVLVPLDREDIVQAIRTAAKYGISILPRGGGTSLAGQAVGESLVIDYSKHLNAVLELNTEERWVRVQPGIVRDELNEQIKSSRLYFTPDVATSNRATVGGMVSNNSSGTRSIIYGKTVDQVIAVRALLSDGEEVTFEELTPNEYELKCRQQNLEGQIYREVRRLVHENADEIRARFPKVMRRAGGYNLDLLLDQQNWNLVKLITGSEGTLAFVTEAKVALAPLPPATGVIVLHFRDLFDALRTVNPILQHGPSALELLDEVIIHLAAKNLEIRKQSAFIQGEPSALLLVEFQGNNSEEVITKLNRLEAAIRQDGRVYACTKLITAQDQAQVWNVRKAGLGLMLGMKGDFKPLPFIEDAAVPVEVLPDYIGEVVDLVRQLGRGIAMYAHASVGLLHVRPILNLKQSEDVGIMRQISERVLDLVLKYGGMMSGEHGDGLSRSYLNEKFFGPKLYQAFREIKRAFDPRNVMNPGKIVDAQTIAENLRIGPHYHAATIHTHFHYAEDGGFDRAVEMCTGVGACRKTLTGTMCPSYMVTRDEQHSTRGRANALRAAMTGRISTESFTTQRLYEVFDLCLACKGCKAECPSNVDVARLKYEFLSRYYDEHGTPLSMRVLTRPDTLAKLAMPFAGVANRALQHRATRALLEKLLGVDKRRVMPLYAVRSFHRWFERRAIADANYLKRPAVVLFDDTYLNYYEPEVGKASVRVLEALGFRVTLANAGCCGRPLISNGLLRKARPRAESVVERLAKFAEQGLSILFCEPSCASAVKEDYPDFVRDVEAAKAVAARSFLIEEFVLSQLNGAKNENLFSPLRCEVLYHGHCHQKALFGTESSKAALTQAAGCNVTEVDSGCCGMAGAFGYEKKHYEISIKIGERRLLPAVRALAAEHQVVANGFSCRHQIEHGAARRARHAIELIAEALRSNE